MIPSLISIVLGLAWLVQGAHGQGLSNNSIAVSDFISLLERMHVYTTVIAICSGTDEQLSMLNMTANLVEAYNVVDGAVISGDPSFIEAYRISALECDTYDRISNHMLGNRVRARDRHAFASDGREATALLLTKIADELGIHRSTVNIPIESANIITRRWDGK